MSAFAPLPLSFILLSPRAVIARRRTSRFVNRHRNQKHILSLLFHSALSLVGKAVEFHNLILLFVPSSSHDVHIRIVIPSLQSTLIQFSCLPASDILRPKSQNLTLGYVDSVPSKIRTKTVGSSRVSYYRRSVSAPIYCTSQRPEEVYYSLCLNVAIGKPLGMHPSDLTSRELR